MTRWREAKYAQNLYIPELQTLIDEGDYVETRGRQTKEILNFVSEIIEPWHHCILVPSRRWNPWIAMSEALWILAGRNDTKSLVPFNRYITDYSDDGEHLYGAYGARIADQLDNVIDRLRSDPNDRRAVVSIWDKSDLTANTKDPPCNNLLYFKLRQDELHMTVINRSNDIHYGLFAVNIPTFGILQEYLAARLGCGIGHQTHLSNSLHVYLDDKRAVEITDRMLYREPDNVLPYPGHHLLFEASNPFWHKFNHETYANMFSQILEGTFLGSAAPKSFYFMRDFLKAYRGEMTNVQDWMNWYGDWILAGSEFSKRVKLS